MRQTRKFKNKEINKYLSRLSELMLINNLGVHNILIVGGAAIALAHKDWGRATSDIDIVYRQQNKLYSCCLQVAKEFALAEDWVNADVMHSESFSINLFNHAIFYKCYNNILNVYIISDLDLFCMKLVSFRYKDMEDLTRLINKLNKSGIIYEDIVNEFIYLYGSTYFIQERQKLFLTDNLKNKK
jgi:hypothetical protein